MVRGLLGSGKYPVPPAWKYNRKLMKNQVSQVSLCVASSYDTSQAASKAGGENKCRKCRKNQRNKKVTTEKSIIYLRKCRVGRSVAIKTIFWSVKILCLLSQYNIYHMTRQFWNSPLVLLPLLGKKFKKKQVAYLFLFWENPATLPTFGLQVYGEAAGSLS